MESLFRGDHEGIRQETVCSEDALEPTLGPEYEITPNPQDRDVPGQLCAKSPTEGKLSHTLGEHQEVVTSWEVA